MKILPHSPTKLAVKDATKHNHTLKDKFGATFKKGNLYAWLVDATLLNALVAEFPLAIVSCRLAVDPTRVAEIRWQRNHERAANLVNTLTKAGFVVVDTGECFKIWGPETVSGSGMCSLAMPDLENRLNRLREWVLALGEQVEDIVPQGACTASTEGDFIPRGASSTLTDVHWRALE